MAWNASHVKEYQCRPKSIQNIAKKTHTQEEEEEEEQVEVADTEVKIKRNQPTSS